jgi:hypothetical protein
MKALPTSHPLVKAVLKQLDGTLSERDLRVIAELVTASLPFNRCEQSGPSTNVNVDWINPAVGVAQDPGPDPENLLGNAPLPRPADLDLGNEQVMYYFTAWSRQQDTIRDLQRSNMEFVKRCENYSERLAHADKALAVANERASLFDAKFTEANNKVMYYQEALAEQARRHETFLEALTNVIEGRFRIEPKGQAAKAATDPRRS